MAFLEQTGPWNMTGIHGVITLPDGGDVETTVVAALKNLFKPSPVPSYSDIKYQVISHVITADENGPTKSAAANKIILFELV